MKLKKLTAIFCTAAIGFTISGCSYSQLLSLNVKKGDKYVIDTITKVNTTVTASGQDISSKETMDTSYDINVTNIDSDKNVTMDYKYDSIKVSTESGGETTSYDSKNSSDNSTSQGLIYSTIIGKGFTVKVNNKGEVLEVKGVDDLLNSVVDKISGDDTIKQQVKNTLSQSFGDDAIKAMLKQSMNYYPDKKVNVGDTWENKYNINMMFPISFENKYKFASNANGKYSIDANSTVTVDTKNNPIDILGVKANVLLNGKVTGTVNLNKGNCFIGDGTLNEDISGTMDVQSSIDTQQKITVPMKVTETITYKTTKK